MIIEVPTLLDLQRAVRHAPVPDNPKELAELVPWRSWSYSPLFETLLKGDGPFKLTSCPRGENHPPDWALTFQDNNIGIEVTRIATKRQEMAYYVYGRDIFDTPGLMTNIAPDAAFRERMERLKAGKPRPSDPDDDSEENWDQVFLDAACVRLQEKYAGLARYCGDYTGCFLLLWDRMFSSAPSPSPRYSLLRHYLKSAPASGFDAVLVTIGGIGDPERMVRLK